MVSDKIHSDFFSSLDMMEQLLILEAFSAILVDEDMEGLAFYFDVSENYTKELKEKVSKYLTDLRELWNDPEKLV